MSDDRFTVFYEHRLFGNPFMYRSDRFTGETWKLTKVGNNREAWVRVLEPSPSSYNPHRGGDDS